MPELKIRKANKKDIRAVLELLYDLERPKPKTNFEEVRFQKMILKYLSDHDKQILIAESDSKISGMVSVVFIPRLNRSKLELYIPEIIVKRDHRGSGIGKSLINSCVVIAKKKKCFRIRLESGNHRKESHKFYKSLGFEQSSLTFTTVIL